MNDFVSFLFVFTICLVFPAIILIPTFLSYLRVRNNVIDSRIRPFLKADERKQWQLIHNLEAVPLHILQNELFFLQNKQNDSILVTNIIKGQIAHVDALIFDLQIDETKQSAINKIYSPPITYLLLDFSPLTSPHFWFTNRSYSDSWMLKQKLIQGFLLDNLLIQTVESDAVKTLLTPQGLHYYNQKDSLRIRARKHWVLIHSTQTVKRSLMKEHIFDLIAEGKYFMQRLHEYSDRLSTNDP